MTATLSHRVAVRLADKLNRYSTIPKESLAYKKRVLGAEIFFLNIFRGAVIIGVAAILGVIPQALLALVGFNILRRTAAGIHAISKYGCVITSTLLMVFVPYFTWGTSIPRLATVAVFGLILLAMWRYAPMDTKSRPLLGAKKRARLKRLSVMACAILGTALVVSPFGEVNFMVTLGAIYSTIFILPITYKLLGREVNNYERYEHGSENC